MLEGLRGSERSVKFLVTARTTLFSEELKFLSNFPERLVSVAGMNNKDVKALLLKLSRREIQKSEVKSSLNPLYVSVHDFLRAYIANALFFNN